MADLKSTAPYEILVNDVDSDEKSKGTESKHLDSAAIISAPEKAYRRFSWPRQTPDDRALKFGSLPGRSPGNAQLRLRSTPKTSFLEYTTIERYKDFMCSNAQTLAERSILDDDDDDATKDEIGDKEGEGGGGGGNYDCMCGIAAWSAKLVENYGLAMLSTIFIVQHLLDGFVSRALKISIKFYLRDYGVSAGRLQTYQAVVFLPLCARGLMGIASDSFRIFGFRKIPWIVISTPLAVVAYACIGLAPVGSVSMEMVMACFVAMLIHLTFCNVLVDAKNSQKIQDMPKYGSDLISFTTFGRTVWSGIAIVSIGVSVAHIGTRWLFRLSFVIAASTLIPALFNFIGDDFDASGGKMFAFAKEAFRKKGARRYLLLACWITFLSVVLAFFGVLNRDPRGNFIVALGVAVMEIMGFRYFTPRVIANVATYHLLVQACQISLSGVYFYFFTDGPSQYPEGPHFSDAFYVLSFGVVDSISRLSGVVVYNQCGFKEWGYRSIFVATTLAYIIINFCNVLYCLRWNIKYFHIPDGVFVMAVRAFDGLIGQLNLMPSILLVSRLCPKGRRATVYSILAANVALGAAISKYNGALVLHWLDIHPKGRENEGHQFDNLWIAALLAAISNATHVFTVPFLVPDANPNEALPEWMLVHKNRGLSNGVSPENSPREADVSFNNSSPKAKARPDEKTSLLSVEKRK